MLIQQFIRARDRVRRLQAGAREGLVEIAGDRAGLPEDQVAMLEARHLAGRVVRQDLGRMRHRVEALIGDAFLLAGHGAAVRQVSSIGTNRARE
jgi:bisphosphoglycerate-independent phosphoglycerate mutase (AlkP superfamily)